jgi:hypothetical protein
VGILVSVRRSRLRDGDINGKYLGWRDKASMLWTPDGYVSWADGGREGNIENARRFANDTLGSKKELSGQ